MPRATFLLLSFLGLALLLIGSTSCAPSSSQSDDTQTAASTDLPELSDEVIRERINNTWISQVPAENGTDKPIDWGFGEDEPKEIAVVEKKVDGTRATVVLEIKTGSSPRSRNKLHLAGQIRTEWELRTGWVLRRWEIVDTENISMKYKDLRKSAEEKTKGVDPNKAQP